MLFPEEKVIIVLSPESEKLRNAPFIREQITDSWLIIKGDETRADEYKEPVIKVKKVAMATIATASLHS